MLKAKSLMTLAAVTGASLLAACTTTGNVERNAAGGAALGAVAGAVIGNAIERTTTREDSLEIMVQLRNGERRAIVQAKGNESFQPGDPVLIVTTGGKVRVARAFGAAPAAPVDNNSQVPRPLPGTRGG